jgi:hypothetical protein
MSCGNTILSGKHYTDKDTLKASVISLASLTMCCFLILTWTVPIDTYKKTTLKNSEFLYPVNIKWGSDGLETITQWDQVCIWGIETFGLPGEKYVTDINDNSMTWMFRDPQDAVFFKLKFSESIW